MSHATVIVALTGVDPTNEQAVEAAVQFQLEPFDENGEWFRDGSRWDWYQIGGRYDGRLLGRNIAQRSELTKEKLADSRAARFGEIWHAAEKELQENPDGKFVKSTYDVDPRETSLEDFKKQGRQGVLTAYAFLRNRHWNEAERMGWFGCSAKTECEIAGADTKDKKCVTKGENGARVVTWNVSEEAWDSKFYQRFVEPLPPDAVLVVVDYHV